MKIEAKAATDVGRVREVNEDTYLMDAELGLYVVCDGMGGHAAGDVASKLAAETLRDFLRERAPQLAEMRSVGASVERAATFMQHGIRAASMAIFELGQAEPERRGMGCTCSALLFLGDKAVMGHVGDSRVYMNRSDGCYQLSEDHTYLNEAVRQGTMTPEEAAESDMGNIVTRAVGPGPTVLVDTLVFDALPGDTFLLCSDGLHNYINRSDELTAAMKAADLEATCRALIETANEREGADNITALVVRIHAAPEEPAMARATRVTAELTTLRHVDLFQELEMKELVNVANGFITMDKAAGEVVVAEGEESDMLFVLVSGEAVATRNDIELGRLTSGDHFGEMALLAQRPRSATVRTTKDCQLLALPRDRFRSMLANQPLIAAKFLWSLAQTLSVRLEESYQDRTSTEDTLVDKTTRRYGLMPSPFDHSR